MFLKVFLKLSNAEAPGLDLHVKKRRTMCEEEMLEMVMSYYMQLLNVCKEEQMS